MRDDNTPEPGEMKSQDMKRGVQPLDQVMKDLGLDDVNLVDISRKQLTFRNISKARKGRQIKFRVQEKILNALNACSPNKKFCHEDIFNYRGPAG